jgi:hypothetical protein
MSFILPVATIVLVLLGSVCIFIAIENDRRTRDDFHGKSSIDENTSSAPAMKLYERFFKSTTL